MIAKLLEMVPGVALSMRSKEFDEFVRKSGAPNIVDAEKQAIKLKNETFDI